jgi:hypothetical protein
MRRTRPGLGYCLLLGLAVGCGKSASDASSPDLVEVDVLAGPLRQLDMVFNIDNTDAPKIAKLNAQLPSLIAVLQDPANGTLPDMRIAVISSDLGTGNAYSSGACGPKVLADGTTSPYGDLGRFQMPTRPTACTFNSGAKFLEYRAGMPLNYTGDITTVLACLTSNLGTMGCGEEQPLQSFEWALAAKGIGNEEQQAEFLRASANLALIFIAEEDDCSAAGNDGMFGDKPELRGESASLRCATRGHECGGRNLTDSPPGYPTDSSFSHSFSDCRARTDSCPVGTDTSGPTTCSPLRNIKAMADSLKSLKQDPAHQILVAGIFGWPLSDADLATAEYKIAPLPNPNPADTLHPTVFDYWPVCYDPGHQPTASSTDSATGFDATAAGWAATGGLREAAFLDEFGSNGLKFSICAPDLTNAMTTIGQRLARMMTDQCLDLRLADVDPLTDGVQPDCEIAWGWPVTDPQNPGRVILQVDAPPLVSCPPGATNGSVTADCWRIVADFDKCPTSGQWLEALRTSAEIAKDPEIPLGTKLHVRCRTCPGNATANCSY